MSLFLALTMLAVIFFFLSCFYVDQCCILFLLLLIFLLLLPLFIIIVIVVVINVMVVHSVWVTVRSNKFILCLSVDDNSVLIMVVYIQKILVCLHNVWFVFNSMHQCYNSNVCS